MKTKWYLFFLTIVTLAIVIFNIITVDNAPIHRIGILMVGESRYEKYTGLREGLVELGYTEQNFDYIVKNANDDMESMRKQIDDLLREDLDVIVTLGGIETIELKSKLEQNNLHIPVVFAGVAAPKEIDLIQDYRAPGGNFTGINNYHTSLSGKRLELFKELVPEIKRVLVLFDQEIKASSLSLEKTKKAGSLLSIDVIPFNVSTPEYKELLEESIKTVDALFMLPGFRIESLTEEIVELSMQYQIPVMGLYEHEVESGYVASYGTSFFDQGHQASRFVSSILQGNPPGKLPVELPDTTRFLVNRQVMEQFNLKIDSELNTIAEFINEEEGK